jgi:hypothetical protein
LAILVISGSGRGAGKTAIGCALLAALSEFCWAAVKVTPHGHSYAPVFEETDRNSDKDTGRFLRAGACSAYLVSVSDEPGEELNVKLRKIRSQSNCDALLVESNQVAAAEIAEGGETVVSLAVLDGSFAKQSLNTAMDRADALILADSASLEDLRLVAPERPAFKLSNGLWSSPELAAFVRRKLRA